MRIAAAAVLLAALGCSRSKGTAPPELQIDAGNWINAATPPTLAALKGRVVWLEFSFLN